MTRIDVIGSARKSIAMLTISNNSKKNKPLKKIFNKSGRKTFRKKETSFISKDKIVILIIEFSLKLNSVKKSKRNINEIKRTEITIETGCLKTSLQVFFTIEIFIYLSVKSKYLLMKCAFYLTHP